MPKTLAAKSDGSPGVVYRGIVDGLYRGRYVPGQRLVEADLTRDFEVGRGSVREALLRDGRRYDMFILGLLRREWEARNGFGDSA